MLEYTVTKSMSYIYTFVYLTLTFKNNLRYSHTCAVTSLCMKSTFFVVPKSTAYKHSHFPHDFGATLISDKI